MACVCLGGFLSLATVGAVALEPKDPIVWQPFKALVGKWEGGGTGTGGQCTSKVEIRFLLGGTYMEFKHTLVFAPNEKNPQGEVHEDVGILSFDQARQKFVLHRFHSSDYADFLQLEDVSPDGRKFVFVTEKIVNVPAGFRTRLTYRLAGTDDMEMDWELAAPDMDYMLHSRSRLKRKK